MRRRSRLCGGGVGIVRLLLTKVNWFIDKSVATDNLLIGFPAWFGGRSGLAGFRSNLWSKLGGHTRTAPWRWCCSRCVFTCTNAYITRPLQVVVAVSTKEMRRVVEFTSQLLLIFLLLVLLSDFVKMLLQPKADETTSSFLEEEEEEER